MHSVETVAGWLVRTLGHEGEYSEDPRDTGNWTGGEIGAGELRGTKWGISAASYPDRDIAALTQDEAAAIYLEDYLAPLKVDRMPDGVAFQLFDFAVHSGPRTAVREFQQAIGVRDDGIIGPVTLGRMSEFTEAELCMLLIAERLEFMTYARTWPAHSRGWVRRKAKNLRYAAYDCREDDAPWA